MAKGLLIVLSAPSGGGKGTILKQLLEETDQVFLSVSATTRSPRPGEEHGTHYYFLQKEEFETLIREDGLLEHACYCENYYGTPSKAVYDRLEQGQDVILEIEVQGALQVLKRCPEAVSVFILPPSMEVLEARLTGRGTEDTETVQKRLAQAKEELGYANRYQYNVVNDTVEQAVSDLRAILRAEHLKNGR